MTDFDSRIDTYEHIHIVQGLLNALICKLIERSMDHDRSKLMDPEREAYDRVVPQFRGVEYGTEDYKAVARQLGAALKHHHEHNRHHPEHHPNGIRDMTLVDLCEMFCDWVAAAQRPGSNGSPDFDRNQQRFGYSDDLRCIFENTHRAFTEEDQHDSTERPRL